MSTQYPQLLTKLIHKWLVNRGIEARIIPCISEPHHLYYSRSCADVIRISGEVRTIIVYEDYYSSDRVKIANSWPREPIWLDHNNPGFFGYLEQVLECGG